MSPAKRMFTKLKNDKGMVYVMQAVEDAIDAVLSRRITSQSQWRASKERQELKTRIACVAALAGNIPSTKKALAQYKETLIDMEAMRADLTLVLLERMQKAGLL